MRLVTAIMWFMYHYHIWYESQAIDTSYQHMKRLYSMGIVVENTVDEFHALETSHHS